MTTASGTFPKAFAVKFNDLNRWDPISFERITWHWPKELMVPIGAVLKARKEKVDRSLFAFSELQPITIHFDGSIDRRNVDGSREYRMELFSARPGDIIVAKIDLKNGAVAIVPEDWNNVVVTGHFAVYEPDYSSLVPEYLHRIIQTGFFKALLWRNKVGAEGRKEVKLEFFEALGIPLPPISVQRSIVTRWESTKNEIEEARNRVEQQESEIPRILLNILGIPLRAETTFPKVFSLLWEDLERWSVNYLARITLGAGDFRKAKYPLKLLGEIAQVSYGIQKSPTNRPGQYARPYLRVANVQRGKLDLSEIKYFDVPSSELEVYRLQRGDLLVCEGNSADLVGRPAIWNDEIPDCVHQNHILRVRVNPIYALPEFVLEYMQTSPVRNYFRAHAKFTTNLASINSNDLRELQIPLPSLELQSKILQEVKERRREIAREQKNIDRLAAALEEEIEEMILGTRPVPEINDQQKLSA